MIRPSARRSQGFTLLEVLMGMTFLTFTVVAVGLSVMTARAASRDIAERLMVQTQAQDYMDLLKAINFGDVSDPDPTSAQLDELFDNDDDPGTITLLQVAKYTGAQPGRVFQLTSFPVEGEWSIQIDNDLTDSDYCDSSHACRRSSLVHDHGLYGGIPTAAVDLATNLPTCGSALSALKSSNEVVRIRIYFNERVVLKSTCAKKRAS